MVWHVFEKSTRYLMVSILVMSGALFAADQCEMTFTGCPETFNNDTILVPDNVVKISSLVHACKASQTLHLGGTGGAASILFVIDNSGSMKGNGASDPAGSRWTVTKDLLDTILKDQPLSEVGLIVFREHLFFDTSTSQFYYTKYFKPLSPVLDSEPYQAYLPFMRLDSSYGGKQGIAIMKDILTTDPTGQDLVYQPLYRNLRANTGGGETNINGAFIGAQAAFANAKNPKDQQYIIFLSDGAPAGTTQANHPNDYFSTPAGVANVPTTFTVFFTANNQAPPVLNTMTNSIKVSGYSASNPKSAIWNLQTSYTALMSLLMQNVISIITLSGNPTKMVFNGKTSTMYVDSSFFFTDSFPLTNQISTFSMGITYRYAKPPSNALTDTTVPVTIYIKKSTGATLPPGVSVNCTPGVPGTVPVVATMLDTNHDGHLDRIDLTWTDTSAINPAMPSVAQFIQTLVITTLDGKKDTLHAVRLEPDLANKTIHVILQENTGPALETGWQNATVVLTQVHMTVAGGPFVVIRVDDGAAPVIKSVCFSPAAKDSLHVVFSEPINNLNPAPDFTLNTGNGVFTFTSGNPVPSGNPAVIKNNDNYIYVFNGGTLTGLESLVEGSRPAFPLSLCGNASIIKDSRVIGNPFIPGKTLVPANGTNLIQSTRIEISLMPAIIAHLVSGKVKGTIFIFDAVGNTVIGGRSEDTLAWDGDHSNPKLVFLWNAKTKKGSLAAPGTYVARLNIEDRELGKKQTIRMTIGIKAVSK
jgi:hypothetical protein